METLSPSSAASLVSASITTSAGGRALLLCYLQEQIAQYATFPWLVVSDHYKLGTAVLLLTKMEILVEA